MVYTHQYHPPRLCMQSNPPKTRRSAGKFHLGSPMHFSQIKGRSVARSAIATISKGAQLALLLFGLLGIASVLLAAGGSVVSPNATASNPDEPSVGQPDRKAPPAMVLIPGGTFLMGTDDVSSFPNERPAHRVHMEGFWIDDASRDERRICEICGGDGLCHDRGAEAGLGRTEKGTSAGYAKAG